MYCWWDFSKFPFFILYIRDMEFIKIPHGFNFQSLKTQLEFYRSMASFYLFIVPINML